MTLIYIDVTLVIITEAVDIADEEGFGVVVDAQGAEMGHDDAGAIVAYTIWWHGKLGGFDRCV